MVAEAPTCCSLVLAWPGLRGVVSLAASPRPVLVWLRRAHPRARGGGCELLPVPQMRSLRPRGASLSLVPQIGAQGAQLWCPRCRLLP